MNVTITTKFLMELCFRDSVQRRPKRGHFTTQLDPNQRREADKVLRNRPSGWNRNAHCFQISKTEMLTECFIWCACSKLPQMLFFLCCWHFYAHIKSKQSKYEDMKICLPSALPLSLLHLPDPATSRRASTSPETGTRACSGRFTGSPRVRTLLLLHFSHTTAPLSWPSIAKVIPQTD